MYRRDQIKGIVAIILFAAIGLTYLLFDESIAKWVALFSILIWFGTMFYVNKMPKQ